MVYQYLNLSLKSHLYLESCRLVCGRKKTAFALWNLQFLFYSSVWHKLIWLINLMLYIFQVLEEKEVYKPVFRSLESKLSCLPTFFGLFCLGVLGLLWLCFFFFERQADQTDIQKHYNLYLLLSGRHKANGMNWQCSLYTCCIYLVLLKSERKFYLLFN